MASVTPSSTWWAVWERGQRVNNRVTCQCHVGSRRSVGALLCRVFPIMSFDLLGTGVGGRLVCRQLSLVSRLVRLRPTVKGVVKGKIKRILTKFSLKWWGQASISKWLKYPAHYSRFLIWEKLWSSSFIKLGMWFVIFELSNNISPIPKSLMIKWGHHQSSGWYLGLSCELFIVSAVLLNFVGRCYDSFNYYAKDGSLHLTAKRSQIFGTLCASFLPTPASFISQ